MTTPARFYDAKQMAQIAKFFAGLEDLIKTLEPDAVFTAENPLYVYGLEIVIRHRDDYTIGRIGMEDFLFFEITDETYGEKQPDAQWEAIHNLLRMCERGDFYDDYDKSTFALAAAKNAVMMLRTAAS